MPDDDVGEKIDRLTAKIESLEAQVARTVPMTPGRAAAEARAAMSRGYEAAAAERAAAAAEGGEAE